MLLLKNGTFYRYNQNYNTMDRFQMKQSLISFAQEGFLTTPYKGRIPVDASAMRKLWRLLSKEIEEAGGLWNLMLLKESKDD